MEIEAKRFKYFLLYFNNGGYKMIFKHIPNDKRQNITYIRAGTKTEARHKLCLNKGIKIYNKNGASNQNFIKVNKKGFDIMNSIFKQLNHKPYKLI